MLDNIPHIKAYWVMMTPRIAQVAQRFGADDLDGTIVEERIYHDAGRHHHARPAPRRVAPVNPPRRPRPHGARHALPPGSADGSDIYGSSIGSVTHPLARGAPSGLLRAGFTISGNPFVGQPILVAAGFQPALFASRRVGFCRKRRLVQGAVSRSCERASVLARGPKEPLCRISCT